MTCAELLDRGDVAAQASNAFELAHVALLLSPRVGDPLSLKLLVLARDCRLHVNRAARAWRPLRHAIAHRRT